MQSQETPIPNVLSSLPQVELAPSKEKFVPKRQQIAADRHRMWKIDREYQRTLEKFKKGNLINPEPELYRKLLEDVYRSDRSLTLPQLVDLTNLQYQDLLQDVPPIKETFSPQKELNNLKALPKPERKAALREFKDKYYRQSQSFATMQLYLERYITNYPDISPEKLYAVVEKFQHDYGYDQTQIELCETIITRYLDNHKMARQFRNRYPDDLELVREITDMDFRWIPGVKPGDIQIEVGPMSIDIITTPEVISMIYNNSESPDPNFAYAGFASTSGALMYTVNTKHSTGTLKHEREHHKNKLFPELFQDHSHIEAAEHWLSAFRRSLDPSSDGICLEIAFREYRTVAFRRLKDEFFAMLKNHTYILDDLPYWLNVFFTSGKYPPYDYLAKIKNLPQSEPHPKYQQPIFQRLSQKILVDEYKETMLKSTTAFLELMDIGDYSRNKAQALLTPVPFELWPKAVKRILDAKSAPQD